MFTGKPLLTFSLIFFSALCAFGQQKIEWQEGSSNGYRYRYVTNDPMKSRFYTLANGLTVILSANPREPRIKTLIGVRAGSNNDPREHTGLAHYLEHLLFKGTYTFGSLDSVSEKKSIHQIVELYDVYNRTVDSAERKAVYRQIDSVSSVAARYAIANEYTKMMTAIGSQGTNAHTFVEETVYKEDIPANAVDKFLTIQAERFRNPVFRLFHTELEAVYEEKNRSLDSDGSKVWEELFDALFPTHNYGQQTTIGTIEHLKNPSLKAIREFYDAYYVPNNMAIVMAGDFNPDELIRKIDSAFSYMVPGTLAAYEGPEEKPIVAPVVREVTGPDAEYLRIGFRLPGAADYQSVVVATVVSQLLSNGKAGLIDLNLNKQQKVLAASSNVLYWKDYSVLCLNGRAREGQSLEEVRDLLLSQVKLLGEGKFDETLIKAITGNFKVQELQGLESNENRAVTMMNSFIQHKGADWDKDVAFVDKTGAVSRQEVIDFVNKYLRNNYVVVFKHKGESDRREKVDKPQITPVVTNNDAQSDFARRIDSMPSSPLRPVWVDYKKEIGRAKAGIADVLYVQNKENDLFRLYYRFDIGSWNSLELGLAAGYLQYLGTDKFSAEEISRQFYNIACNFSISPDKEYTTVTISGLQENFQAAVKLFEDLIRNCRPDENALEQLKARLHKARADAKLNKTAIARGLNNYAMYGPQNPYNHQLSDSALQGVTASRLTEILHAVFQYRHTIIYYGPQSLNTFTAAIRNLHRLPKAFQPAPQAVKFEKQDIGKSRVLFTPYDMVQAEITWVTNNELYDPARTAVIDLFNNYFGGSMSSIVFGTIRESKALAYSTYAFYATPDKKQDRYSTVAYVGCQADKMEEALAAMNELLTDLPRSDGALEAARESILKDIASQRITQDDIIFSYLAAQRLGLETDLRKQVYERVPSLGFEDVRQFHGRSVSGKPFIYCVVGSADKVDMEVLRRLGEVRQVSLEDIFGY